MCAGSTTSPGGWCAVGRDHPRGRGEHRGHEASAAFSLGSLPQARGARNAPPFYTEHTRSSDGLAGPTGTA